MAKHLKNNSKFNIAIAAILALVIGAFIPQAAFAATSVGPSTSRVVVSPSSTTTLNTPLTAQSSAMTISGFGSSPSTDLVRVELTETGGGKIQLASTSGLTAVTGMPLDTAVQDSLGFTGSVDSANAALAGLKYVAGASFETASVNIVVSYAGTGSDLYAFYGTNEHFYKYVSTGTSWTSAKDAAAATTFNGMTGYLATSTSSGENAFITSRVGSGQSWLGGQHPLGVSGVNQWAWQTGPEAGTRFWDQTGGGTGSAYAGAFNNWQSGEPNGPTGSLGENSLQIVAGGTGTWNDLIASTSIGYVIEFGGLGETVTKPSTSRTISVEVNYPEAKATSGNCVQNIANTTGVTVLDPNGDGSKCIVKFSSSAASTTWRAPTGVSSVESLIVAGGGGGGAWVGGGGGAGGLILKTGVDAIAVTAGSTYAVSVGAGGSGAVMSGAGPNPSSYATNGSDSVFSNQTAFGGGGGASWAESSPAANTGGSGGGGSGSTAYVGATGTAGQGNAGGSGHSDATVSGNNAHPGGGGGGAGAAGGGVALKIAGNGGAGISTDISGTTTWYGGGGGGGIHGTSTLYSDGTVGAGGQGGGGSGAGPNRTNYGVVMTQSVTGQAGTANTGGGGGGAGAPSNVGWGSTGGAGGSGIVILSYVGTGNPTITSQPADTAKVPAQTATFAVVATSPDSGTLSYQWQVFTTAITASWTDISGATSASYTTGSLTLASNGYKYRVNVTNTIGSAAKTVTSNAATLSVSNIAVVDVAWNELNYDYTATHYVPQVGNGKAVGDKVLFKNVITRNGTCVDSVVTTKTLSGVTGTAVKNYETGTGAGGAKTNFEVDIDFSANDGYGEFQFDFFVCGTYDRTGKTEDQALAAATRVELRNLAITLIDIDYYQWNEATGMDSFTLASNTKLKYGPAGTALATGTSIGTTNGTIASFPANVRFQGPSSIDSTLPEDQAIINYGSIQTFNVKMGRSASGSPNYFGVAFKSLSWGSTTPATQGPATTYTITYDGNGSNGGAVPSSHTGKVGANFTVLGNTGTLAKTGYTFAGWNTAADGSGTSYAVGSAIMMPKDGLTLYALWTASSLALTYNANSGTAAPASETRVAGATANLSSSTPTRSGYTFSGWNKAADGSSTGYSAGGSFTMPGTATTLYAQWTAATGTIAYNGNGGSGSAPASSTGTTGNSYTVLDNTGPLAKTGFTFAGWNTAANGTGTDYAAGSLVTYPAATQTTTLYAQWTAVIYSLSYNANGGVNAGAGAAPTQTATSGATLTLASATYNPTRSGYTFAGWYTTASGSGGTLYNPAASNYSMPAANTVLYAKWTAITYNVTYNGNAPATTTATGTPTDATAYALNASVTVANKGSLTVGSGYRFTGWNTMADGSGTDYVQGAILLMPVSGITLYAKWVDANIVLTFDANGGVSAPPQSSAIANQQITLPSQTPTRAGYTFLGWTEASNNSGTVYSPSGAYTAPGSNGVLYAKWAAISYTFYYNANGGTGGGSSAPVSVTGLNVGGLVTVYVVDVSNPAPTRAGYSFTGWNAATDGTSTNYAGGSTYTMGPSNYTIYAQWLGNPFTLTYNSNGGTAISPTAEVRRADATANITGTTPTRSGYTFSSWNTAANGTGTTYASASSLTMPASNVTLYAQWTALNNGVSYNANGGSGAPTGANYNYGASVTVSNTAPTRTGYTFTGWNTQQGGGGTPYLSAEIFSMPNAAVVLYAQWTATTYALNYDANGGAGAPGVINYAFASTATVSATMPTRNGYDFQGWNTDIAGVGTARAASGTFTMPANDVTLYAQWSLATYTVYYNANGGTGIINPQPGRYNTNVTLSSSVPTRSGYTFGGWNTATDGSGLDYTSGGSLTIPANNVTLYAKWTATSYTLTYDANGGANVPAAETGKTVSQTFGLAATTSVSRSGYWFSGWNTQADGTGVNYASGANFTMPASNVTLYAKWVVDTYTVSYNANGGTGAPAAQSTGGGTVTIPSSTSSVLRPGYTFSHWYTTPSGTGGTQYAPGATFTPSGNVVLYAIWTPLTITVHYDINGGATDAPVDQSATYDGQPIQLAGSGGFAKANSQFLTWNTVANGTGTSYAAEDPNFRVPSSNITLYAIWSAEYFAVEYKPNGGTGAPGDQFAAPGETVNVAPAEPQKAGYDFVAWSDVTTGNTYSANAAITMPTSNVTLVANWVVKSASVPGGTPDTGKPVIGLTYPKKLNLTVYFKGDRSYLIPATVSKLKKLAATAKQYGYATNITIYGRVKETNDKSYDAKLSKARAINVAAYLKKLGVKGVFKIIPAGISPENKAISRRVDMTLFWNKR